MSKYICCSNHNTVLLDFLFRVLVVPTYSFYTTRMLNPQARYHLIGAFI